MGKRRHITRSVDSPSKSQQRKEKQFASFYHHIEPTTAAVRSVVVCSEATRWRKATQHGPSYRTSSIRAIRKRPYSCCPSRFVERGAALRSPKAAFASAPLLLLVRVQQQPFFCFLFFKFRSYGEAGAGGKERGALVEHNHGSSRSRNR